MNDADALAATRTDGAGVPRIRVGVSEFAISATGAPLATSGLGSCIGVAVYDPVAGVGGLGHVMLPTATSALPKIGKFADTCVPALLNGMERAGADPDRVRAKLAGGSASMGFTTGESIGTQNAAAVRGALAARDVPVVAADLGGSHGRSLVFRPATGALEVSGSDGNRRVI